MVLVHKGLRQGCFTAHTLFKIYFTAASARDGKGRSLHASIPAGQPVSGALQEYDANHMIANA